MRAFVTLFFTLLLTGTFRAECQARDGFFARYVARTQAAQKGQPEWVGPLVTTTPKLEEQIRADFIRQRNARGFDTWNLGSTRGLQLIPFPRTQLGIFVPPFFEHSEPGKKDGFGDFALQLKYRVFARDEGHGNSIVTAFVTGTLPTGKNDNGSCCAEVNPGVVAGKGWGRFDVVTSANAALPATGAKTLGRNVVWNTAVQFRAGGAGLQLWPEVESNSAFFIGGRNDGNVQSFVTPGVYLRRIPVSGRNPINGKRASLTVGGGMQMAVTHFHNYNHALVFVLKLPF